MKYKFPGEYIELLHEETGLIECLNWYVKNDDHQFLLLDNIRDVNLLAVWTDLLDSRILAGKLLPIILGEEYVSEIYRNAKR
jgi:hypothetical protein